MAPKRTKERAAGVNNGPESTGSLEKVLTNAKSAHSELARNWLLSSAPSTAAEYQWWLSLVTAIAFVARFWSIWYPREVVFDEVHFGKFASYYLERVFFFDVHPPLAKMMIAFVGWLCGYDGAFKFDEIGDSYDKNPAPFLAYRCMHASLGTLTVPLMFLTLKEVNCRAITCAFGSLLVALDTAHVLETRLILLDATLLIFIAATVYCYVRFYKYQLTKPLSKEWYAWLYATGLSLSGVISTKYVGVMTYATIGVAVVTNLWQLLDIRAQLPLRLFARHTSRRLNGLILIPFLVYLFWFYVHFQVLNTSGPGDSFMSATFQETLGDSYLTRDARPVNYYDILTLKHKETSAWLHSHVGNYPLRYEDGRISSQGQQVTGYTYEDMNNEWEVLPVKELPQKLGQPVLLSDHIRLRHVGTNTYLKAHDVASPLYATNEEITTVSEEEANNGSYQQTLFSFKPPKDGDAYHKLKTKVNYFRIFHVDTAVALWTHDDQLLPDWGYNQQEVNGNKKIIDTSNLWFVDNITNLNDSRLEFVEKEVKPMPFLNKWYELQMAMFEQNNKLSAEHPAASQPQSWPTTMRGVSFWTDKEKKAQIYMIGNMVGFWLEVITIVVYLGVILADLCTRQRSYYVLNKITRERLYGPTLFFFMGWACHYFPFFMMARQKFLHHYLPAHLIAAMFTACFWEIIFTDTRSVNFSLDESSYDVKYEKNPILYGTPYKIFLALLSVGVIAFFIFFSPLVYGASMTTEQILRRKIFNIVLSFEKD